MPDLLVVVGQQVFGLFANFTQRAEDVHVQHAARVAAVEAFDKTVLHRASLHDEVQQDAFALGSLGQGQRDKFRSVVQTELVRIAAPDRDASNVRMTRAAVRFDFTSIANASRLKSSMTLKVRKRRHQDVCAASPRSE